MLKNVKVVQNNVSVFNEILYLGVLYLFIWEQTAICATYSINWLVFITEMKSVYSAVRTGSLNKAVCAPPLKVNILYSPRSVL